MSYGGGGPYGAGHPGSDPQWAQPTASPRAPSAHIAQNGQTANLQSVPFSQGHRGPGEAVAVSAIQSGVPLGRMMPQPYGQYPGMQPVYPPYFQQPPNWQFQNQQQFFEPGRGGAGGAMQPINLPPGTHYSLLQQPPAAAAGAAEYFGAGGPQNRVVGGHERVEPAAQIRPLEYTPPADYAPASNGTMKKRYPCKICGQTFAQSSNLTRHKRVHTGEKPYACSHCDVSFANVSNRKKHELKCAGKKRRALAAAAPKDVPDPPAPAVTQTTVGSAQPAKATSVSPAASTPDRGATPMDTTGRQATETARAHLVPKPKPVDSGASQPRPAVAVAAMEVSEPVAEPAAASANQPHGNSSTKQEGKLSKSASPAAVDVTVMEDSGDEEGEKEEAEAAPAPPAHTSDALSASTPAAAADTVAIEGDERLIEEVTPEEGIVVLPAREGFEGRSVGTQTFSQPH